MRKATLELAVVLACALLMCGSAGAPVGDYEGSINTEQRNVEVEHDSRRPDSVEVPQSKSDMLPISAGKVVEAKGGVDGGSLETGVKDIDTGEIATARLGAIEHSTAKAGEIGASAEDAHDRDQRKPVIERARSDFDATGEIHSDSSGRENNNFSVGAIAPVGDAEPNEGASYSENTRSKAELGKPESNKNIADDALPIEEAVALNEVEDRQISEDRSKQQDSGSIAESEHRAEKAVQVDRVTDRTFLGGSTDHSGRTSKDGEAASTAANGTRDVGGSLLGGSSDSGRPRVKDWESTLNQEPTLSLVANNDSSSVSEPRTDLVVHDDTPDVHSIGGESRVGENATVAEESRTDKSAVQNSEAIQAANVNVEPANSSVSQMEEANSSNELPVLSEADRVPLPGAVQPAKVQADRDVMAETEDQIARSPPTEHHQPQDDEQKEDNQLLSGNRLQEVDEDAVPRLYFGAMESKKAGIVIHGTGFRDSSSLLCDIEARGMSDYRMQGTYIDANQVICKLPETSPFNRKEELGVRVANQQLLFSNTVTIATKNQSIIDSPGPGFSVLRYLRAALFLSFLVAVAKRYKVQIRRAAPFVIPALVKGVTALVILFQAFWNAQRPRAAGSREVPVYNEIYARAEGKPAAEQGWGDWDEDSDGSKTK